VIAWCEAEQIDYCLGLSKNARLLELAEQALLDARIAHCLCGGSVRRIASADLATHYRVFSAAIALIALGSAWQRPRRTVEHHARRWRASQDRLHLVHGAGAFGPNWS
jgi:hypothetical protein